jgi:hypothetical protein
MIGSTKLPPKPDSVNPTRLTRPPRSLVWARITNVWKQLQRPYRVSSVLRLTMLLHKNLRVPDRRQKPGPLQPNRLPAAQPGALCTKLKSVTSLAQPRLLPRPASTSKLTAKRLNQAPTLLKPRPCLARTSAFWANACKYSG